MLDYAIAKEELRRLTKGVIPIALILFGAFVLLGQPVMQVAAGIVSGTAFALWSFYLMSRSAVRAVWQGDPARASKIITRSYAVRYEHDSCIFDCADLDRLGQHTCRCLNAFFTQNHFDDFALLKERRGTVNGHQYCWCSNFVGS